MDQSHQKSFYITLTLIFLLPLFFIPGSLLALEVGKSALLAFGTVVVTLVFLWETWREGKLNLPWHPLAVSILLLPLVYLLSSLLSTPSSLSLFGYIFEVGTFGFMSLAVLLLLIIGLVFHDTSRVLKAIAVLMGSFALVAVLVLVKIMTGGSPVWGIFAGNTGNPIGRWTDLAAACGLLNVLSILTLTMVPMKKGLRVLVYALFVLSLFLLAILNFSHAFIFALVSAVVLAIYFSTVEKNFFGGSEMLPRASSNFFFRPIFLPVVLGIVSLICLINPTISDTRGKLGDVLSRKFNVTNSEVRPSFSATLSVSKAALAKGIFLGSGPNTFGQDWLVHKPVDVNTTPFWGTIFTFGIGFIPTQIATTGILGVTVWLFFLFFLVFLGFKFLKRIPESRALRFALVSTFLALLYLWGASFFYAPSMVMLVFAFILSGLFLAASIQAQTLTSRSLIFSQSVTANFASTLLIVAIGVGSLGLGYVAYGRVLSAHYFKKAVDLANTDSRALTELEALLNKANSYSPSDVSYVGLSRIYFAQAEKVASDTTNTPDKNLILFQEAVSRSIGAARMAIELNPSGYANWSSLGLIYGALVPKPLAVAGAYENAKLAYAEAAARNPKSPEIPLFLAQLEVNHEDTVAARAHLHEAIALKDDYVDAYLMLAQIEIHENNVGAAITSAEQVARLVPGNPAIYFELGLLKYTIRDYNGASEAFAMAVASAKDYANAKYYLGLSLARLNKLEEAKAYFEELAVANPDNAELKLILTNLRAGKSPF